jgi:hypothetical protein
VIFTRNMCKLVRSALVLAKGIRLVLSTDWMLLLMLRLIVMLQQLEKSQATKEASKGLKDACFDIGGWAT